MNTGSWEWFIERFEKISRIDLKAYKRPQMERRINSFMRSVNAANYQEFVNLLTRDKDVYRKFLDHITINVSEFFRNPAHWEILRREIVPLLLKQRNTLKIWSAGCSTGEEPYSLAMAAKEDRWPLKEKILATDIDREVLEKAGMGLYTAKGIEGVPTLYLKRYFIQQGANYRISDEVRQMVNFKQHDLLKDAFGKDFDLILCRNVVIYFTEETKDKLYRRFAEAMRPGGVIFIGSTEQIFNAREMGLKSIATFFYQKI
ncbi:protein-glutamate O-methyltransferase CheR [Thermosyntropha sp.]|uniref:CheR family methyltransferase n=1 Tax=Thermosyntropha sp. TaxID=2740820 RepID=UPI0025DCFC5E|nr:protein-glutamate O-methyltransferase CheR [Thermosyntropha sp.]MBO8159500.1 protein-glutamate O-methyltransferase CheR [Thermosyntropha sp.]